MIKTVCNAYKTWAENVSYSRAARELSSLSDRELNDLGIGRGEIWTVVRHGSRR